MTIRYCTQCGTPQPLENATCVSCGKPTSSPISIPLVIPRPPMFTYCDGCRRSVDFDAIAARAVREVGGTILCELCKPEGAEPS